MLVTVRRPRRRPPTAGQRRTGHAGRRAGAARDLGRRRTRDRRRQPGRRRHRAARLPLGPQPASPRSPSGAGVNSAVACGDVVVLRSATIDEPGGRWRLPNGGELDRHAERPLVQPRVALLPRAATANATAAVLLPTDHDGSPLPVLLDPYGGPHAQRVRAQLQRLPHVAMVRRPGIRGRGRRRPRHAGPRLGVRTCRVRSDLAERRARRPDRGAPRGRRRSIPSSTSRGSRSAAGASAATSRHWPCCVGPTCSTPPSPARRSPSGGSTTRTTPSATSATPTSNPRCTTPTRCCRSRPSSCARCCSCTVSPTTTSSPPTRCSCRRRCSRPAGRTRCCRSSASPT